MNNQLTKILSLCSSIRNSSSKQNVKNIVETNIQLADADCLSMI